MSKLLKKKVTKKTVKDLRKSLKGVDNDKEVILAFYYKGEVHHVYLSDILVNLKHDGVIGENLEESSVVELGGYDDSHCIYIERDD